MCILTNMKYGELLAELGEYPFFDWAMVLQMFAEGSSRGDLRTQLSRWTKRGRLLSLRRGMYAWPKQYAKNPLNPAEVANVLCRPSYLSGLWALGYYGVIPEQVVIYTSITSLAPTRFENVLGQFEYRHVKREAFFGYQQVQMMERNVCMAEPEKALLDYWHLNKGTWSTERMESMRFQAFGQIRPERLTEYARRYSSPRLEAASRVWMQLAEDDANGTQEI